MPRPVTLFTGQWADLPLEEIAQKASEWGYQGLELCCWGDHFEVQRALSEPDYCQHKQELLARYDLQPLVVSNHRVGQAVCDPIDRRHQALLPDYVWGDGKPQGVQQRAAEEMMATVRAAQKLGVSVLSGFTGSSIWPYVVGYPMPSPDGKWFAFVSDQSGEQEVFVRSLEQGGEEVQVSQGGGTEPVWSPDGHELYYRGFADRRLKLMAATIRTKPELEVVSRTALFSLEDIVGAAPHANYAVSPDGKTFVMVRRAPANRIIVLQNLPELVRRIREAGSVR